VIPSTLQGYAAPNGTIHTQLVDADTFIVQYTNVKPYSQLAGADERFTGQVVLKRDGKIRLNYKSFNFGQDSATIGIQNSARNQAIQLAHNQPFAASNLAVQIAPPISWLTTSATSANAASGATAQFTLAANTTGLVAGNVRTFNYTVTPSGGGQPPLVVPVRLQVLTPLESWKLQNFGLPTIAGAFTSGTFADLADPDGDGVSNLLEYAFGGNPSSALSAPLPTSQISNLTLQITFTRARSDLTYVVQGSNDLLTWTDLSTNPGTVSLVTPVTYTDSVNLPTANPPRRFLRLKVSTP